MEHKVFAYKTLDDLTDNLKAIGQTLRPVTDLSVLAKPISFGSIQMDNRIAFQAMEGCDGEVSGAPSELTRRRYRRFAASGAAFQYIDATAVVPTGRANPLQLMINQQTAPVFAEMVKEMRAVAKEKGVCDPFIAIQLTHSGRSGNFHDGAVEYSRRISLPLRLWGRRARLPQARSDRAQKISRYSHRQRSFHH